MFGRSLRIRRGRWINGLRIAQCINLLAGLNQVHFLARLAFNGFGVGLQCLVLLFQLRIILLKLQDVQLNLLELLLLPARSQVAVLPEDVMDYQRHRREQKRQDGVADCRGALEIPIQHEKLNCRLEIERGGKIRQQVWLTFGSAQPFLRRVAAHSQPIVSSVASFRQEMRKADCSSVRSLWRGRPHPRLATPVP